MNVLSASNALIMMKIGQGIYFGVIKLFVRGILKILIFDPKIGIFSIFLKKIDPKMKKNGQKMKILKIPLTKS